MLLRRNGETIAIIVITAAKRVVEIIGKKHDKDTVRKGMVSRRWKKTEKDEEGEKDRGIR